MPEGKKVTVDPASLPLSREGKPGSILDVADGNDVEIDHACGGVCACSTCHVIVRGLRFDPRGQRAEEDMLDEARARGQPPCVQAVPDGTVDVVVEIPGWNRNHAKESH